MVADLDISYRVGRFTFVDICLMVRIDILLSNFITLFHVIS